MRTIIRTGRFNANLLCEQITETFPEFFEIRDGERFALFTLNYDGTTLTLRVPDNADLSKLQAIAAAHNPDADSVLQTEAKRALALKQGIRDKFLALGFTLEELKFLRDFLTSP